MSEGETVTEGEGGDNGGLFCQSCSPTCRKICYYATFGLGFIAFIFGIIKLIEGDVLFLVIGASLILLSPLWIKSVSGCCSDMKNALRLSSFLIFLLLLIYFSILDFSKKMPSASFIRFIFRFNIY